MKNHPRFRSFLPGFFFNLTGLFAWFAAVSLLAAAPTTEREWTSTAGTKLKAVAESVSGGKVRFKTSTGRKLVVPLDKLVDANRYISAIAAMDEFGRRKLAPLGNATRKNFTTPKLEAAAKKLSGQFAGVPEIEEIAAKLGEKTGGF